MTRTPDLLEIRPVLNRAIKMCANRREGADIACRSPDEQPGLRTELENLSSARTQVDCGSGDDVRLSRLRNHRWNQELNHRVDDGRQCRSNRTAEEIIQERPPFHFFANVRRNATMSSAILSSTSLTGFILPPPSIEIFFR